MNRSHALVLSTLLALAGCTGAGGVQPNALMSTQQEAIAAASAPDPQSAPDSQTASLGPSNPRLTIAPAIGAPDSAAAPLSAQLAARAQEIGIPLTPVAGADGLTMKGYFSAITEGPQTTVIYVWDVIDGNGNRLTRIQGQEHGMRTAGEGWASVEPELMQRVADQTIDAYASWLLARAG